MISVLYLLAILVGFYVAWSIGANDVANSVGTAVGSRSLSLRKAIVLAAIFEFLGSFLLGANVSETLEVGMLGPQILVAQKEEYLIGMFSVLLASGIWIQIATFFGWPVSTTHTIIGAILGFGLLLGGMNAIEWGEVASIGMSWIVSPLLGAVVAYLICLFLQHRIFYNTDPVRASQQIAPWIAFWLFFVLIFVSLFNGLHEFSISLSFWQVACIALICGCMGWCVFRWRAYHMTRTEDPFQDVEKMFQAFHVVIACFMSVAHGSNDVANVIGPLSGIINLLGGNSLVGRTIPIWLLFLGGAGIVVGFATWGWRVIDTVGKKITQLTPSKGFAAGAAASLCILIASKMGLPVSTTHVLVGSVLGVGMARGIGAINLRTVLDIGISWIITVPIGALLCVALFYLIRITLSM